MPSDLPPAPTSARPPAPATSPAPARAPASPSDSLLVAALAAVDPAFGAWRSAVASAAAEVRGILSRRGSHTGVASTLGAFAAGRIDLDRFAGLVERGESLDAAALGALARAADVLVTAANAPAAEQVVVHVPDGARMRDAVGAALARLGRTFGAARVAAAAQQGRWRPDAEGPLLDGVAASAWTKRERRIAPPLVVSVAGADLDAASLVEGLDGGAKVVLLVRGPSTPAPLVRLVTPGAFVLQSGDATGLDAFAKATGPAVAAIFPDAATDVATFVHDPAAGPTLADRLVVRRVPTVGVRNPVGGWSSAQQAQELAQLGALTERSDARPAAAPPASPPTSIADASGKIAPTASAQVAAAATSDDPAGRLAAWLLGAVDGGDARG